MMTRKRDLWKVVGVILLAAGLWNYGPGETETAAACEAPTDHSATMLAACRRELVQINVLALEVSKLVTLADANFDLLMQRCRPIPPRSGIRHAMGRLQ